VTGPRLGTPQDWNSSSINGMITTQLLGGGSTDHSVRAGGQFSALPGLSAKSRDMVWSGFDYGGGFEFRARYLPPSSTTSATPSTGHPLSVINIGGSSQRRFPNSFHRSSSMNDVGLPTPATVPGRVLRKQPDRS
jgi:hypothetical protein